MASAKALVDTGIKDHKVFIISKTYCPFCTKAKKYVTEAGFTDVKIVEIESLSDCSAIQEYCATLTKKGKSVPKVWIGGKFIGGGDETEEAFKNGELQKMVN